MIETSARDTPAFSATSAIVGRCLPDASTCEPTLRRRPPYGCPARGPYQDSAISRQQPIDMTFGQGSSYSN
ncbi:hypothetical protein STAFG_3683 [Streptomyces afghaniensis 772]|uniref:Uncharacterized protein n=1 Tax=Streptomyces afghaniensis 772 TaxID=1283301 RepID=S4MIA1_9ACTN|nr:hypothetical protein STAFG_3683 [Streptomyces afghaniensis 772]